MMSMTISKHLSILSALIFICSRIQSTESVRHNKKVPIELDEDSWTRLLKGEWMFDLYAPWCPACKRLEPEWRKLAEWSEDLNINVASADVTANPALSGRFLVRGLPTIYHIKDGVFRIYEGSREHAALMNFIEDQGWKKIEPVSRWLAPDTLQMSFLAYSFRVSMTLRDIHNHLVENVGVPYYVSYLIFALCTVTLGTLLGLVIVFIIDLFCPARYTHSPQGTTTARTSSGKKKDAKDSDLEDTSEISGEPKSSSADKGVRRRVKT